MNVFRYISDGMFQTVLIFPSTNILSMVRLPLGSQLHNCGLIGMPGDLFEKFD